MTGRSGSIFFAGFMALIAGVAGAATYKVDPAASVFAVVTHRAGIAAAMAHNHFVAAGGAEVHLATGADGTGTFDLSCNTKDLVADDPKLAVQWSPRLVALGILDEALTDISESDRATIRDHMLAKDQLDADEFPKISASVEKMVGLKGADQAAKDRPTHELTIALTVRGKTIRASAPARIVIEGTHLEAEATAKFRFDQFGIEPYSTALGAVRNGDEFHVFAKVSATEI